MENDKILTEIDELMNLAGSNEGSDEHYLYHLAQIMARALDADESFISEIAEQNKLRTLAFWNGKEFRNNFEHTVTASLLAKIAKDKFYVSNNMNDIFQHSTILFKNNEGCCCIIPLLKLSGEIIGILGVIYKTQAPQTNTSEQMLKLFSLHASPILRLYQTEKSVLKNKNKHAPQKTCLTENEKKVLYGVACYPLLTDKELSLKINVKRSTITIIRNKLKHDGFYNHIIIPNFTAIGCELMCIIVCKSLLNSINDHNADIMSTIQNHPEVVYSTIADKDWIAVTVSKSFADIKRITDLISSFCEQQKASLPEIVYLPFELNKKIEFYNSNNLLKNAVDLNFDFGPISETNASKITSSLSDKEKQVLYALVKYPNLPDSVISSKTKISRPTISKIRKKLIQHNIITSLNIANAQKLDCEIFVYMHLKVNAPITKMLTDKYRPIFTSIGEKEIITMGIFKDYSAYKYSYDNLMQELTAKKLIALEPTIRLMSLKQIIQQKLDLAPIVKKVLNLNIEF